jgi:small subunit ribosomal protein S21
MSSVKSELRVCERVLGAEVMRLAEVRLQRGRVAGKCLRRFKRKVQQEDIIQGSQAALLFYLKPGEKKRVKEAIARKRARKKSRKESD